MTLKSIAKMLIWIGLVGMGLNFIFGGNTVSYITRIEINGIQTYKYDFHAYISNIFYTAMNPAKLEFLTPPMTWQWITSENAFNWWSILVNDLACILNTGIMFFNIVLWPIRMCVYVGYLFLAIIGINFKEGAGGLKWLIDTMEVLMGLQIPYINI